MHYDIQRINEAIEWFQNSICDDPHHTDDLCPDCRNNRVALWALERITAQQAENDQLRRTIVKYAECARVVALYLRDFCNSELPYGEMIADAARKAEAEIKQLRWERDAAVRQISNVCRYIEFVEGGISYCELSGDGCDDCAHVWRGVSDNG